MERPLATPPLERFPADLRKLATEYVNLVAREAETAAELRSVENRRPEAVAADTAAHAAALRTGRKDPGTPAATAADAELATARRLLAALTEAVRLAREELVAAAAAHRAEWLAEIAARRADTNARAAELLAELGRVRTELGLLTADDAWLAALPAPKLYKGAQSAPVPGLRSASGEPYFVESVLGALLDLYQPRSPEPAPAFRVEPYEVRSEDGALLERGQRRVLVPAAELDRSGAA